MHSEMRPAPRLPQPEALQPKPPRRPCRPPGCVCVSAGEGRVGVGPQVHLSRDGWVAVYTCEGACVRVRGERIWKRALYQKWGSATPEADSRMSALSGC